MTRRTVVTLNAIGLALGVTLIVAGVFLPTIPGMLTLAFAFGLIIFCSVVGVVLFATRKRDRPPSV